MNLRATWCLATIINLVLLLESSLIQANPDPRIINGELASFNNTKHQVSIRLKCREFPFGKGHICGGSLIGPNKVLTAAHCVYNTSKKKYRSAKEFSVVMGTLNRFLKTSGTIVSDVASIATLGPFDMTTLQDDVALMFLETGLPENKTHLTVEPIILNNITIPAGSVCQVSGWGKTSSSSSLQNIPADLRIANVSIVDKAICTLSYQYKLKPGMLCAGDIKGGTDSCQGDSGGPLIYNGTLVGVVSWGTGCALPGYPGVYADVKYYIDWIVKTNRSEKLAWSWIMHGIVVLMLTLIIGSYFRWIWKKYNLLPRSS